MQETQPLKERSTSYQILYIEETIKNKAQIQEIERLLEDMIPKEYHMEINKLYDGNGDVIGLAGLNLTETERNVVGERSDVQCIEKDFVLEIHNTEATDTDYQSMEEIFDPIDDPIDDQSPQENTSDWDVQRNADGALIRDCQYPDSVALGRNFVHRSNSGQSTFIYVLGWGVQLQVLNRDGDMEFKQIEEQGQEQGLMDRTSHMIGHHSLKDGDPLSHGTIIASKAAGKKYGLAKQATIVSVRFSAAYGEWENAVALVLENLRQHPERQSRSVVLSALSPPVPFTYMQAKKNPAIQGNVARSVKGIVDLGVPFVTVSGNHYECRIVDMLPQVLDDDDMPLIVVGAAWNNRRTSFTQIPRDGRPIIYAPGTDVESQTRTNRQFSLESGTSIAAPHVAGLIATYLPDDSSSWPWENKTGLERVVVIRDYLTSDHSSWVRPGGVRMIWNGATKEAHESDGP